MRRPLLPILAFVCSPSLSAPQGQAGADARASQMRRAYAVWMRPYQTGPLWARFGDEPGEVKLIVTAIEGDDPNSKNRLAFPFRGFRVKYGCAVSTDGRLSDFSLDALGEKGGGYPRLAEGDRQKLDALLADLPDDHSVLPPPDRRLVLQVAAANQVIARVYDRANAPESILEILRLTRSRIRSWVLTFPPNDQVRASADEHAADDRAQFLSVVTPWLVPAKAPAIFPAPHGQRSVHQTTGGEIELWDSQANRRIALLDRDSQMLRPAYSPDESMVAAVTVPNTNKYFEGPYRLRIWRAQDGALVRELRLFEQKAYGISGLLWWPDGRYLLAATRADHFFNERGISIWSVQTGRHRGELTGCSREVLELALQVDGRLLERCGDGMIRAWRVGGIIDQIREFEASLADSGGSSDAVR